MDWMVWHSSVCCWWIPSSSKISYQLNQMWSSNRIQTIHELNANSKSFSFSKMQLLLQLPSFLNQFVLRFRHSPSKIMRTVAFPCQHLLNVSADRKNSIFFCQLGIEIGVVLVLHFFFFVLVLHLLSMMLCAVSLFFMFYIFKSFKKKMKRFAHSHECWYFCTLQKKQLHIWLNN